MALFNRLVQRTGNALSEAELKKFTGGSPERDFLRYYATGSVVHHFDDFLGDTINLDNYAVANSGGTSAASFAIVVAANGLIQCDTGTDDNGSCSLIMPLNWYGDQNAGLEMRVKCDAVTGYNFELGFIDAVPAANASGVSDIDTPAATFTDGALIQIDTDQTLATLAAITDGTAKAVQATTFTSLTNLTAATYATFRVQLIGDNAYYWVNGKLEASHVNAIEGGTAVAPWVYVRTRNTTAKFFDIDYIRVWQDRV